MSTSLDRVTGLTGNLGIKIPVRVATTANITLSGLQTIDGILISDNVNTTGIPDRILVKDQTDQTQNGIYNVSSSTWTRSGDFDGNRDVTTGTLVYIISGSTNGTGLFKVTSAASAVIGTDNITFGSAPITGPTGPTGPAGPAVSDGDKGDIVVSSTGTVWTIDSSAVTTSKIAANAVDGTKIALGSDAQGDIMYYNGTDYARLAAGSSGLFLKTLGASANPLWAAAGSGIKGLQYFTSSGTYTPTSGATTALVFVQGGGGGGGSNAGNGNAGGNTTFGALATGNGGSGGGGNAGTVAGGAGGTATTGTINLTGQAGEGNVSTNTSSGAGGVARFLGGAGPASTGSGVAAIANSGSGGSGFQSGAGGGGGAGGLSILFYSSIATQTVTIGAAGTPATSGGAGGAGYILVLEF